MAVIFQRSLIQLRRNLISTSKMSKFTSLEPVKENITQKLSILSPEHLQVINESHMHNVPSGSETHFKVVVVSDKFEGLPLIKRHRLVNEALDEELKTGVHALSIVAKTSSQWKESTKEIESSPTCRGGFGK